MKQYVLVTKRNGEAVDSLTHILNSQYTARNLADKIIEDSNSHMDGIDEVLVYHELKNKPQKLIFTIRKTTRALFYRCPKCGIKFWVEYTFDHPEDGGDYCPCCKTHQDLKEARVVELPPLSITLAKSKEWQEVKAKVNAIRDKYKGDN